MGVPLMTYSVSQYGVDALERIALVRRLASRLEQQCERFLRSEYGLSWPQFQVLRELSADRPTKLQQVNDAVFCTRGNLAAIVDRLERDGWLVRMRRQGDRRVVLLGLTEKGARVSEIDQRLQELMAEWLAPQQESAAILTDLTALLRDLTDPLGESTGTRLIAAGSSAATEWLSGEGA